MENFEIIIPVKKIPSVNAAHKIGRAGNKVWIYLSKEIKDLQEKVRIDLLKNNVQDWAKNLTSDYILYVDIIYCFNNRFWLRDVTNLNKYVEDGIAMTIDFNDNRSLKFNSEKVMNDLGKEEFIVISIQPKLLNSVKYKWSQFINES
ncbi:MAG: hypothetical protein ACTTIS_00625 [Streptobacillus sp.]